MRKDRLSLKDEQDRQRIMDNIYPKKYVAICSIIGGMFVTAVSFFDVVNLHKSWNYFVAMSTIGWVFMIVASWGLWKFANCMSVGNHPSNKRQILCKK